eukprot:Phypoly_transcript_21377.p1 GENE.Phypoly_transcript_21377~~Phypoly_transcript_21377.p1  ORF type:complete len:114 (+),score=10.77 Phypoly_transcript_21377:169-510(+)
MGKVFKEYLNNPKIFICGKCKCHLSSRDQLVSKQFQGRNGTAFLFSTCINVLVGPSEDRLLTTGLHTVADIYCKDCEQVLGWKYEEAYKESEKYKIGKFILERTLIVKDPSWE